MLLSFLKRIREIKGVRLPSLRTSMKNPFHTDLCWFWGRLYVSRLLPHSHHSLLLFPIGITSNSFSCLSLRESFLIFFWAALFYVSVPLFSRVIFLFGATAKPKEKQWTQEMFPFPRQRHSFSSNYMNSLLCAFMYDFSNRVLSSNDPLHLQIRQRGSVRKVF